MRGSLKCAIQIPSEFNETISPDSAKMAAVRGLAIHKISIRIATISQKTGAQVVLNERSLCFECFVNRERRCRPVPTPATDTFERNKSNK